MTQQTQHDDAEDFFGGGGAPSFKFTNPNDYVQGEIVSYRQTQQTEYNAANPTVPGKPKVWENGDPMMQLVVVLQTTVRDPHLEGDDGRRTIYVRGALRDPQSMAGCIRKAVADAGAKTVKAGGMLTVQFTGLGTAAGAGNPPKQYRAIYQAPADLAETFLGQPDPFAQQQPTAPVAAPAPQVDPFAAAQATAGAVLGAAPLPGLAPTPQAVQAPPAPVVGADQAMIQAVAGMVRGGVTDDVIRVSFPACTPQILAAIRNKVDAEAQPNGAPPF